MTTAIITATGSYIPQLKIRNDYFLNHTFFDKDGTRVKKDNTVLINKLKEISGIEERRYATSDQQASDLGFLAAQDALNSSGIDKETLDYIIVAHNFGDVTLESNRVNLVPSIASRIKFLLQIKNPDCVAYDLPFGCPGWVEAMIQANYYIRSGDAKRCLVIGAETLSRVVDPHDIDSMLFSDGSGATILEASDKGQSGILSHKTQTYADENTMHLTMSHSNNDKHHPQKDIFIKMNGRKVYEFALSRVPQLIKDLLDKTNLSIHDITKVIIHQANEKMDSAILERVFKLYEIDTVPEEIMPMTIGWLGNSSVATVPTLLDLIMKEKMDGHKFKTGDKIVLASVGAGMNINAIVYQF